MKFATNSLFIICSFITAHGQLSNGIPGLEFPRQFPLKFVSAQVSMTTEDDFTWGNFVYMGKKGSHCQVRILLGDHRGIFSDPQKYTGRQRQAILGEGTREKGLPSGTIVSGEAFHRVFPFVDKKTRERYELGTIFLYDEIGAIIVTDRQSTNPLQTPETLALSVREELHRIFRTETVQGNKRIVLR
jgi:hypothetical protein